jgi:BTB/POZ domain-containing protein 1/2
VEPNDSLEMDHSLLTPIKLTDLSTFFTVENFHSSVSTTHNWQATKSTIKERLGFMFGNELMADVYFIVGRESQMQRVPAHKFVLSVSSAVFDAMFNGGMATSSAEIELPDVEPAAFISMLRFLYTDEVRIGPETVMQCLYTAKKYAVVALERACVDFLKRNLSSDNAFMLLTQARLFDEPQLAALCLEMIDKTTSEALSADGFTDVDIDTLCTVLERDTLGIKECKLFFAVCRWAEVECTRKQLAVTGENQRLVLGPHALELIRFPLMSVEEFAAGPAQSGLLTDRELVQLFLYFTLTPKPTVKFSDVPRCCMTGKEQVISRFCQIETRWGYSGTSDRIRFVVNRKIFIVGFGLYGSIHAAAEYLVSIQIIQTDTGHTCGSNDTSFGSDGTKTAFRVMFKEPVEIQPNTSYTACATLKGPDSYYGTKGLRKVTHESVSSGKVTFQFTYAAGNNNGTSVEDGQLPEIIFYT